MSDPSTEDLRSVFDHLVGAPSPSGDLAERAREQVAAGSTLDEAWDLAARADLKQARMTQVKVDPLPDSAHSQQRPSGRG